MLGSISYSVYDSGTIKTLSYVADGGTAIGHKLGSYNTLSTSGAKILSVYNDNFTTEKFYVDKDGNVSSSGYYKTALSSLDLRSSIARCVYITNTGVTLGIYANSTQSNSVNIGYGAGQNILAGGHVNVGEGAGQEANAYCTNIGYWAGGLRQNSTKQSYMCNLGYKAGYFSSEYDINIGIGPYGELFQGNQSSRKLKLLADVSVFDPGTLDSEVLDEIDFSTYTKWTPTGSISLSSNNVSVTGAGTLTQASGDFVTASVANSWYCLEYEVTTGASSNRSKLASITTSFALSEVTLPIRDTGIFKVYFKSAAVPSDFVIETFGSTAFVIDNFSLKRIIGGDLDAWSASFQEVSLASIDLSNVPSGADQATAGVAAGYAWIDTDDNCLKIGV